jgi:acetyl esterase/lipase
MAQFPVPDSLAATMLPLWDGPAPLSHGTKPDDTPSLVPFLPEQPTGSALLIIPGGGYMEHAFDEEGIALAERYKAHGTATFLLRYRLAVDDYRHPVQLLDAQRAMRVIRSRAKNWGIDPARIAAIGFSAGGHLAGMLATHAAPGNPAAADPVERESSRPDAAILVYPVITYVARKPMCTGILDPHPTPEALQAISLETLVTPRTPPTLLVHGIDDTIVSVEHSRLMFAALQKAGVPSAYHEYPVGKHGFGCWRHDPSPSGWLERVEDWCQTQGCAI